MSKEKDFPIIAKSESMTSSWKDSCPESIGIDHPGQIYYQHMRAKGHVKNK
jgi:hypothetical protein